MKKSQGFMANQNGKCCEQSLIPTFEKNGYTVVLNSFYEKNKDDFKKVDKLVLREVPFTSIYNHPGRTEFVIVNGDRKVRIEVKSQHFKGSVDEKMPYVYMNAVEAFPEKEVVILLEGNGMKKGAVDFLKNCVKNNYLDYKGKGKTIHVFDLAEFVNWFNHEYAA